jgi:uncharacterized damage-inducible protein DinB
LFISINGFLQTWEFESSSTQKMLDTLTNESLKQAVKPNDRTLGGLAWHIVTAVPNIVGQTGLILAAPDLQTAAPSTATEIADAYRKVSDSLVEAIKAQWTDATLMETCNMFGQFESQKGMALSLFINHQIHHRGQMIILMRQADLIVPGVYGPAKEEWNQMGIQPPEMV